MQTDELDFQLPPDLIAQEPPVHRASSRLLHYRREKGTITHRRFDELPTLLRAGDLLVFNDTKVLPARFTLRKATGGLVEGLFLEERSLGEWRVLLKNPGQVVSHRLVFESEDPAAVTVTVKGDAGEYIVRLDSQERADAVLQRVGRMPLPPYIKRDRVEDTRDASDRQRYQTVFARESGAVAAPTAALHFTHALLDDIRARGVETAFVTLHVGMGTFKPVMADRLDQHAMHIERYTISREAAVALNDAKRMGRRIIAVGTTSARVLESQPADEPFVARSAETGIFIYPPYQWRHVASMITNFHLPRSTLIAMIAAMVGLEEQRRIYQTAIAERYRFFSYGDAMWME